MNKLHIFEVGTVVENSTDSGSVFKLPKALGRYYATKVELKDGTIATCYSFSSYSAGDIVCGFTLREINNVLCGVIIDNGLLDSDENFEGFSEYESFMLYQNFQKPNREAKISDEDFVKQYLEQNGGVCLVKSSVKECVINNVKAKRFKYCKSKIVVPFGNCNIEITNCPIDYYVETDETIYVYFYIDCKGELHVFPIAKCFNHVIYKKFEIILKLLSDQNFLLAGFILFESQKGKWKIDEKVRIMITSEAIKGKGQGKQCYARAISMYPNNKDEIEFDGTFFYESTPTEKGEIFEALIKSDYTFKKQVNTNNEERKVRVCFTDDALTVKEKDVFSVELQKFYNHEFEFAVQNGVIGTLHYDVLNWIGILGFATEMDILRLILNGIIPENAESLSKEQRKTVSELINESNTVSAEFADQEKRTVNYNDYFGFILPKKIINKLSGQGLINKACFSTGNKKDKSDTILYITKIGRELLAILGKNKVKCDSYAVLRTPLYVKRILASNQLLNSLLDAFCKWGEFQYEDVSVLPTVILDTSETEETDLARVGFSVDITKNDNTVTFMGDAVRNMVGLSKNLDRKNMEDKIPRMFNVISNLAKNTGNHTVLILTFVSYEEIELWLKNMSDALEKYADSEYFHFYVTYDGLTRGDITGGLFEIKDGQLTSVSNVEEEIQRLFQ